MRRCTALLTSDETAARRDRFVLAAILGLAALLRFAQLPGRGEWDNDQGTQLLTMSHWVRGGDMPLLGPISSNLTVHHGVAYYWVLAPSAFLTDTHPVAAVATLTMLGLGGVAATWWLGRTVGGPLAGHVAGLLMAVSPAAISTSTFIWNPNIVGPGAALASAAAWHAWRTRRARWWLAAAPGVVLMLHGHLLAVVAIPPLLVLLVADVWRRPRSERSKVMRPVCGAVAIVAAGYIPLIVYELRSGFAETSALIAYLTDDPAAARPALPARLPVVAWRVLSGPMSGPDPSAPVRGMPSTIITIAALAVAAVGRPDIARLFGRWAVGTTLAAVLALCLVAPDLLTVFAGLPRDQYHAWLTPILLAVIAVAVARVWNAGRAWAGRAGATAVVVTCVGLSLASMPPLASSDGGWPAAAATAAKIVAMTGSKPIAVVGVAKGGAALSFPLDRQHAVMSAPKTADFLVVTCDPLFERRGELPCGGTAEANLARYVGFPAVRLVGCFVDGPRRVVCVFSRN